MFEALLWISGAIALGGMLLALDGSRDVFHPLAFIGPMMVFLYAWMPSKLLAVDGLSRFFDRDQLVFIQSFYACGIAAFVVACLSVGLRVRRGAPGKRPRVRWSREACRRLLTGGALAGSLGLGCWLITIRNVGGFVAAFSASYSGGWDDSGYIRDGSLQLLVGGPTFAIAVIALMGWYMARRKRPPAVAMGALGLLLGWLVLFLVTNRGNIYLGSDRALDTHVSDIVETPDTGNEYIYGGGSILSAERANHYFWMRRYLAQILVRPIPSAIWPTKYEDFGVPELLKNAGTGEGFGDALGWEGAVGSAPGIIADLWVELWWLAVPAMAVLGWLYGFVWKRAVTRGGPWASQYIILSALSIYLVMQTMEAVIFRTLLLSIPCWLTWRWALRAPAARRVPALGAGELREARHA